MSVPDFPYVVLQPRYRYFMRAKTNTLEPIDRAYFIKLANRVFMLFVFLAVAGFLVVRNHLLAASAVTTNGRITQIDPAMQNDRIAESVYFEFILPDGRTISRNEVVDIAFPYQVGQEILITYADDLTVTAIGSHSLISLDAVWVAIILATLSSLYFGNQLLKFVKSAVNNRQLAQRGIFLPGSITNASVSSKGRDFLLYVEYTFTSPSQKQMAGRTTVPYIADTTPPSVGTPLVVLYVNDRLYKVL